MRGRLRLGCPVWSVAGWVGEFYATRDRSQWLAEYSSVFETVEGNSTFYALPDRATTERWAEQTSGDFRFCWKVPRSISHDASLLDCQSETDELIDRLRILQEHDRLGPTLLQLGPAFDATCGDRLIAWLETWPHDMELAVEVRHADWFDEGRHERLLDQVLRDHNVSRCLFDSRALFASPPETPAEVASQQRKPRSPFRATVTNATAMVRFIGRDRIPAIEPWIRDWTRQVTAWLEEGLSVYLFTHAPNDQFAPAFARRFVEVLADQGGPHELPTWPAERGPRQMELF